MVELLDMADISVGAANWLNFMVASGVSNGSHDAPTRLEGKATAIVVCWFLGLGSLILWNSMLTIGDYYYALFPCSRLDNDGCDSSCRTAIGKRQIEAEVERG